MGDLFMNGENHWGITPPGHHSREFIIIKTSDYK